MRHETPIETAEGIQVLLRQGRGPSVELLPARTPPARLAATMAAMANSEGGTILMGVSPASGQVQGLDDADEARDRVLQAALLCDPPLIIPLPQPLEAGESRQVLCIQIPHGLPHVYAVAGRYWTRS